MRLLEFGHVKAAAPGAEFPDASDVLASLRLRKEADEIAAMRRAVKIAQAALESAIPLARVGMSEKELAEELSERPLLGRDVFSRIPPQALPTQLQGEEPLLHVNLFQLMDAFKKLLDQKVPGIQLQFRAEQWSVQDKVSLILEKLKAEGARSFQELFEDRPRSGCCAWSSWVVRA